MKDKEKIVLYREVIKKLDAMIGVKGKYELDDIGKMAIISAVLKGDVPYFFFIGFYRVYKKELLQIGPYQGDVIACGTIHYAKGVCGACAFQEKIINVPDVRKFPGYIACDFFTKSEIVVPVKRDNKLIAVLDVDSAEFDSFSKVDELYLKTIAEKYFRS